MNQLTFTHPSFQAFMQGMTAKRKRPTLPRKFETRTWLQLALKLVLRRLVRAAQGITWTREDGKKIWVRSVGALVKAIQEYDGYQSKMLPAALRGQGKH